MKAIVVNQPGNADQLKMVEMPCPTYTDDDLLIRVKATSLNRADIFQRKGKYLPPLGASQVLGLDVAGVVEKVGKNVEKNWKIDDQVFGLVGGGGYAEYAVIPAHLAMPIPSNLTFEQAAAIPEVFLTAYQTLHWIGGLKRSETVLIHAGASGVGTAAIQLVKVAGSTSIVTVGSEEKRQACLELGAKYALNYQQGSFLNQVQSCTHGQGVHLILDFIGSAYFKQNIDALQVDGRMVLISALGGHKINRFSLSKILSKRIQLTGTTLRSRNMEYKRKLVKEFAAFALPLFQNGTLKPIVDQLYTWHQVQHAHQYMEENKNIGKIVMRIEDE